MHWCLPAPTKAALQDGPHRTVTILQQNPVDDPAERVELRTHRRPAPPVPGRYRKRQHLRNRPRVDPKTPRRFPPAQTLDAQLNQLRVAGCSSRNIYREKVTGARADRRELLRMLDRLAPGDVVTVTRIDRLARSTFDLFEIVKKIVDAKAQFRSLAEPWADTAPAPGG